MESIQKYYDNTQSDKPRNNVEYFINEIQCNSGNAIELGCGAGNDTVYLIKNNWNVLAIDREDVKERIAKRLTKEELAKFKFQKQNFIVANYSLSFCNKNKFSKLWNKINDSIFTNRIFCW